MKKSIKTVAFSMALLIAAAGSAQSLSPVAMPASGGFYGAGPALLSWTLGQSFYSTYSSGSSILTQGCEQPEIQIRTGSIHGSLFYPLSQVTVPYTALDFTNASNVFTAQLSNATGSFSSAVTIGMSAGTASGSITATIPAGTIAGTGYRIRVVSSLSKFAAPDNGIDLTVAPAPAQGPGATILLTSGGYYAMGSSQLSWTLGQTFNTTFSAGSVILTQGFEQPEIQIRTDSISGSPFCQLSVLNVGYTALDYTNTSNIFTAQLSNSSGSFSSPVTIGTNTGTAGGSIIATIPAGTAAGTGYRIRVVGSGSKFSGPDNGTNLIVNNCSGANTWTGAVSTTWATAGNWSLSTPGSTSDAIIPSGLSRYPVVTSAASVNNLTLNSGASVTVSSGQTLSIYGTLTNNGTASFGPGTVQLSGGDTLYGSTAFGNLTVAGYPMVGPNAGDKISVSGILLKSSGNLITSNKLTLISTSTQTAIIEEGSGSLTGSAYVERYYGGYSGYSEITSPVSGATLANVSGLTIQGTNGTQSSLAGKEGTVEDYCEPCNTTTSLNNGYYNYTSLSNPLTSGLGLSAYTSYSATFSYFGTPATGNISYNITKNGPNATTAGWDLIGNPYPSPISWTELKNANSGVMNATCYIWSPNNSGSGAWEAYNGGASVGSATDVIALGQGFFVLKNTAGTTALSFTNAVRYNSLNPPFYKTNLMPDEIRLTLTGGENTSEVLSYTQPGTTTGYDADADGPMPPFNMGADASNISFVSEGQPYLIDVYDHVAEDMQIPLAVHTATAGTYTINAKALNVGTYPVYLLDKATNTYYDLASQSATFTSQGNEDKNNYSVVFKKASGQPNATGIALESLYPNPANGQVSINVMSGENTSATLTMTDVLGRVVMTEDWALTAGYNTNQFDISRYADGAYTVTITSGDIKASAKLVISK